jgi:hypothetical protein
MFMGFDEKITYVKMKKLGKKIFVTSNWKGHVLFMKYLDGKRFMEQDEGGRICVIKGKDE